MTVVLDECVPKRLRRDLTGHSVQTVQQLGLAGVQNGTLLARLGMRCDAFVTVDQKLHFQQQIARLPFAVIVLISRQTRTET